MTEQIIQGTDAWLQLRAGRATGSNFDACMAKGRGSDEATTRRNYRVRLALERLTGKVMESGFKSPAMAGGIEREPLARMAYEACTGHIVDEVPFIAHDYLMAGVSPDGLVGDDGMIEVKCPTPAVHWEYLQLADSPPREYKWQVFGQLWVSKRKWVDFVSYNPDFEESLQLHIVRIHRDEELISSMNIGVTKFLHDVDVTVKEMRDLAAARKRGSS